MWFCFESVLQDELDKDKDHRNNHCIWPSRNTTVSGVPDVLYYLPQQSGGIECLHIGQRQQVDEKEHGPLKSHSFAARLMVFRAISWFHDDLMANRCTSQWNTLSLNIFSFVS